MNRRQLLFVAAATASLSFKFPAARAEAAAPGGPETGSNVFPKMQWDAVNPSELGWSLQGLSDAYRYFASLPPASLVVVDRGRMVLAWGDDARRVKLSSVRKSLLSALYGRPVEEKRINLDATLESLGVDDEPPLTQGEKQATVRTLLQARSGIYHAYVGGTPAMRARMPARGSAAPGARWSYNNWDFNALGGIYEARSGTTIGQAFASEIAGPIGMQDFRPEDMYYLRAPENAEDFARSKYPAYHFRLTTRDMARFGHLYLHNGNWDGTQVISEDWIRQSTQSYSDTSGYGEGFGYGYLWWINGYGLNEPVLSARGALGKYIVVLPKRNLVVAFANHTEFPEGPEANSAAEMAKLPDVPIPAFAKLLALINAAQRA